MCMSPSGGRGAQNVVHAWSMKQTRKKRKDDVLFCFVVVVVVMDHVCARKLETNQEPMIGTGPLKVQCMVHGQMVNNM